jgi:hypothetical protein
MAVNGELLVYPGQELTPQDFAIMMERISVIRSGILSGCTITFSETESNTLNVAEGYAFVRGRLVKVNAGTLDTSNLSTSATSWFVYVRLHINPDVPPVDICTVYATDTEPTDATETFNEGGDGIAYATLATIKVSDRSITQFTTPEIGTITPFLLERTGWGYNISSAVYTIQLEHPAFSPNVHMDIVPRNVGANVAYIETLQRANIHVYSISDGVLVLGCYGTVPTVDLEIGIIFRGAL